jgi:uncharacterized protein (TIGR03382 family)
LAVLRLNLGVVCLAAGALAVPARAELLNLDLLDSPDIASSFIDVMYDAGSDQFTASGFAMTFDNGAEPPVDISSGVFSLAATITDGGLLSGGSLTIQGDASGFGPTLLTGELVDFGYFDGGGDLVELLFTVTGGDLATPSLYGDPGAIAGVILNANGSSFTGSFALNFDNNGGFPGFGIGTSDTASIPAPGALLLLLVAGSLQGRRRRTGSGS